MRKTVFLNNDREMPMLGLGVCNISDQDAETAVSSAISSGFRLFDTAPAYKNEESIGRALSRCRTPRKSLFITSKIWNNAQRLGDTAGAFTRSMERLKLDYLDMYMIHWPVPGCYLSTWTAMESLLVSGRVLSIGVCNFSIPQLEDLQRVSGIVPAVNQIEVHPFCYPRELIEYCQDRGIMVQAYAPLARGAYLDHDILCILATKYAKTPAQIGLRWLLQKNICVIPKSSSPAHIEKDADLWSFEIMDEDMEILDSLNENKHMVEPPEDVREFIRW